MKLIYYNNGNEFGYLLKGDILFGTRWIGLRKRIEGGGMLCDYPEIPLVFIISEFSSSGLEEGILFKELLEEYPPCK